MDIETPWAISVDDSATAEDIFYCFRLLLGRTPQRHEWSAHVWRTGQNLTDVVRTYTNSREFSGRRLLAEWQPEEIEWTQLDGFSLYTASNDHAVGTVVRSNSYEPHITRLLREHLKEGMAFIDIGANIGYFTMMAASLVGPRGHVLAVEPNPQNVLLLEASRRRNDFSQVAVAQAAASDRMRILALNSDYSNGTTSQIEGDLALLALARLVPAFPLSKMIPFSQSIDLIKIDVEGAEYLALKGATDIIQRDHPIIASEFSPEQMEVISGITGSEYLEFLKSFGYEFSVLSTTSSPVLLGGDVGAVLELHKTIGGDHLDILATQVKAP
jgi:FkbM family methyltransferase